jgi:NADH-quinone oxidoreductase subunit L
MFRLMFMTFWGESRSDHVTQGHIHESPAIMTAPLVLLAVPAAALGIAVGWPPEAGWLHHFLEPVFFEVEHHEFHWLGAGGFLMVLSLAVVLVGIAIAYRMYVRDTSAPARLAERMPVAYRASLNKLYMDEIYEVVPIRATVNLATWLWTWFDVKVIDGAVNGIARLCLAAGERLRPLQTGRVQNYALSIFVGMAILVVVFAWVWVS